MIIRRRRTDVLFLVEFVESHWKRDCDGIGLGCEHFEETLDCTHLLGVDEVYPVVKYLGCDIGFGVVDKVGDLIPVNVEIDLPFS